MQKNKGKSGYRGWKKGGSGDRGGLVRARSTMGYSQFVKVSANVALTVSTTGNTFVGISGFGTGTGSSITPYSNGTNYATLSQWGDFRLSKIKLNFIAQVGSAGDPLQVVSALDSTGGDIAGGTVTGAFNTIMSRQTAKRGVVTPMQQKPVVHVYNPVEFQNRAWNRQSDLSAGSEYNEPWGVLVSTFCPASSTTITMYVDWYFEVREPTLSGVLLGKEDHETHDRLIRLERLSLPQSTLPKPGARLTGGQ
jgi:hypothetical protein